MNTKIEMFGIHPDEQKYLEEHFSKLGNDFTAVYHSETINPENITGNKDTTVLSVFVDCVVNGAVMDAFPELSLIVARSTGYDNIDLKEAEKRGITVCNVPSYGEKTVAEFTFGLILSLSRKIYTAIDRIKENSNVSCEDLRGFDLADKTIGVIGTGKIGRHVIKIAKGFGMNVIAFDTTQNEKTSSELGFKYVSMDELLNSSDVVTIHVPYSINSKHLINASAISKMKKTAILVNTSRGGLVDTNALATALSEGKIAGAGLDVLEEEDAINCNKAFIVGGHAEGHDLCAIIADHALLKMPNVVITPHIAFNTKESLERILNTTIDNIRAWQDGSPTNIVK